MRERKQFKNQIDKKFIKILQNLIINLTYYKEVKLQAKIFICIYFEEKEKLLQETMQQQLKRIKSKDLSSYDNKLFNNLDKVQTINETLQNLQQFQQFLLIQIGQFEKKAKQKNNRSQVKQVIQQNCQTLRQSIMRAVPDLQSSRARFRQEKQVIDEQRVNIKHLEENYKKSRLSYINQQKLKFDNKGKISNTKKQTISNGYMTRYYDLLKETNTVKQTLEQIKKQNIKIKSQLSKQISLGIQNRLSKIKKENIMFKVQNQDLKSQIQKLKDQNIKYKNEIQQLTEKSRNQFKQNEKSQDFNFRLDLKKIQEKFSKTKETNQSLKKQSSSTQLLYQSNNKSKQYQSFAQKMKLDFTSKLGKYADSQLKLISPQNFQINNQESSTFRQSNTICLDSYQSNQKSNYAFRSIEIQRTNKNYQDPDVPKPLRKNSISKHFQSCNASESVLAAKDYRHPLTHVNINDGVRSCYQSAQKVSKQQFSQKNKVNYNNSTSKKSNHDLMRKTKSNFFKKQILLTPNSKNIQISNDKQNCLSSLASSIYQTNIAKMKGLTQNSMQFGKQSSQNKKKLKLFSMF